VFPVRYQLNFYIVFSRNAVFKGLKVSKTVCRTLMQDGHKTVSQTFILASNAGIF
jgi:hypothetical protein